MHELQDMIESALYDLIDEQTQAGNAIDVNGNATITDARDIAEIEFGETRGRQGMAIEFTNGSSVGMTAMSSIDVVPPMGEAFPSCITTAASASTIQTSRSRSSTGRWAP